MKFLKGLALVVLSLLLFLSLSIFGLALTLNYTILNPDFVVSALNRLDISSLAGEFLSQQIPQFEVAAPYEPYVADVLDDTIADLEPWVKEQVNANIYPSYDYLMGKSQSLNVVISLEPVKDTLKQNLREAILNSPPPELKGLPPAEVERYFNEFYQDFTKNIPTTFEFNESSLSPEVLAGLEQVKQGISYFQLGYKALIGFILLLILGIILINREVKGTTRGLGITFLTYGVLEYAGIFAAKHLAGTQLPQLGIPASLQAQLPQLLGDFLAPLEMFSIGIGIAGVVLLIVSFVYKRREPEF